MPLLLCSQLLFLPLLLAFSTAGMASDGEDFQFQLSTSPMPTSLPPPPAPAVAFAATDIGCREDGNATAALRVAVRPPTCATGFQLTLEIASSTGCPVYRCETGEQAASEMAEPNLPTSPLPTPQPTPIGCPSAGPPSLLSCPGRQVAKTVLEPLPGAPRGWCLSRRCACPDFDAVAAACAADKRMRPLLAVEKKSGCRVLVECRLAMEDGGSISEHSSNHFRCPPPSIPNCGPGMLPERRLLLGCPLYWCPTAAANSGDGGNSTACPPPPSCPPGAVSVIEPLLTESTASAVTDGGCPRRVLCERLVDSACPSHGCASDELAVPLLLARTLAPADLPAGAVTAAASAAAAACPPVACLGLRVPPWLAMCPGTPRYCPNGGSGSVGLRTELSVTEFGAPCVSVICQQMGRRFWHWEPVSGPNY